MKICEYFNTQLLEDDVRRGKVIEHNIMSFEKGEENTEMFKKNEGDERNQ